MKPNNPKPTEKKSEIVEHKNHINTPVNNQKSYSHLGDEVLIKKPLTDEEIIKKQILDTCESINDMELAGYSDRQGQIDYRKLQKRKMYLKAKFRGYKLGKSQADKIWQEKIEKILVEEGYIDDLRKSHSHLLKELEKLLADGEKELISCLECNGMGEVFAEDSKNPTKCKACNGKGLIEVKEREKIVENTLTNLHKEYKDVIKLAEIEAKAEGKAQADKIWREKIDKELKGYKHKLSFKGLPENVQMNLSGGILALESLRKLLSNEGKE